MPQPDTQQLIELAKQGDTDAFSKIVSKYSRWMLALASLISSPSDAEDIAQDVWITAWRKLGTLNDNRKFKGWLRTMVTRESIKRSKKILRFPTLGKTRTIEEAGDNFLGPSSSSPESDLATKQTLIRALSRLNANERVILVLTHYEGLNAEEASSILNLPIGTVKSRLFNTRKKLKNLEGTELEREKHHEY